MGNSLLWEDATKKGDDNAKLQYAKGKKTHKRNKKSLISKQEALTQIFPAYLLGARNVFKE